MSIAEAVESAGRYLTEHPSEAVYRDSPARARIVHGLAAIVTGPHGAEVRTDMPTGIGGQNSAPSPGWLLRAAEASCVAALIVIRAAAQGIELGSVEVEVDSESDDRGILGLDDDIPSGPLNTRILVNVETPGRTTAEREDLVRWAVDHCPVVDAVRRAVRVELDVR